MYPSFPLIFLYIFYDDQGHRHDASLDDLQHFRDAGGVIVLNHVAPLGDLQHFRDVKGVVALHHVASLSDLQHFHDAGGALAH